MEREEDILKKLKKLMEEEVEIPDSLQPERIREKLIKEDGSHETVKRRKCMKNWITGGIALVGALAAAFAIIINSSNFGQDDVMSNILTKLPDTVAGNVVKANKKKIKGIKQFKDYKSLYKYFAKASESRYRYEQLAGAKNAATDDLAATNEAKAKTEGGKGGEDYSKTNTRTDGVDEADVVKTDGKYIYILKHVYDGIPEIRIIKADKGRMETVSSRFTLERNSDSNEYYYSNIMLEGSTLIVFREGNKKYNEEYKYGYFREKSITELLFYDISNPEKPVLKAKHSQEGSMGHTRMKGGIIYTFSNSYSGYYYPLAEVNGIEYDDLIPKVDGKTIGIKNIYVPEYSYGDCYMVVTSVDIKNPEKIIDSKVIMDAGYDIYVSYDNIYFWNTEYKSFGEQTKITKYSYKNGIIEPQASASILGALNNDYSLDEYKGNLRFVITKENSGFGIIPFTERMPNIQRSESENALYILDQDLKVVGKIEGLAKGEYIKSARFMGDMAYFVTFRQTDPLFSVDVSDPANPKILGYLKIPGFSEYLHPFGNGLLFGLGQDADEKDGGVRGLKLSMFDISDSGNIKEIAKSIYSDGRYSHSDAEYDRKAITIDADKNIIGFSVSAYDESRNRNYKKYVVYGFDKEKGFYEKFSYDFSNISMYYGYYMRGVYIEDYFYIVPTDIDKIVSFDIKTDKKAYELEY